VLWVMLMLVRVLVQCRNMAKDEEIVSECVSEDALQVATSLLTRSLTHSHLLLVFLWPCSRCISCILLKINVVATESPGSLISRRSLWLTEGSICRGQIR
jgi:hypothetical protein